MNTSLDAEIRSALVERRGDWARVANVSGVSYSWLSKFVNGRIPNPGLATLRKIAGALPNEAVASNLGSVPENAGSQTGI